MNSGRLYSFGVILYALVLFVETTPSQADENRVSKGLQALYTFDGGSGDIIQDRSGVGRPLNLKINKRASVRWREGALHVHSPVRISSGSPAGKITSAVKRTNSLSIEAWVKPKTDNQSGPARIVSISGNASQRNVTLGQERKKYDLRLRTSSTSGNGIPSTSTKNNFAKPALTHVVATRTRGGRVQIYVNGKKQAEKQVSGKLKKWDESFKLILGNEVTGGRPWLGEFHLVAIYSRALTSPEVRQNYNAGIPSTSPLSSPEKLAVNPAHQLFETKIAPLLANKCLECHDSAIHKGKLDLSRKVAAFKGGESGPAIVPNKLEESLLWEQIESGVMPPEGDSLTDEELVLFRQWIKEGAAWPAELIDPVIYSLDESAHELWIQRLTIPEYITTVESTVGVDISKEAYELLPPDLRADGFSNTSYNLNVDLKHVEAYARLAELIVSRMDVLKFVDRFQKERKLSTDATMRKTIAKMGKWLFRGPLDDQEVTNYSGIATTVASTGGDFKEAMSYIIEAMLQSPRFIYRIENQQGDGEVWPISDYEMATRISYILWGGPPDEKLMRAADKGELNDKEVVKTQIERMLKDPKAVKRSSQFLIEWLDLNRLSHLSPSPEKFPNWDASLANDMRAETLAFFEEIVWKQNRPLADLFNAQVTFLSPALARHYGLQPNEEAGNFRYDLKDVPSRGGLLTQGSILTAGGDDASMVTRGLFVLHDVLRGMVKDPPPGLDITPVPAEPGVSRRQISEHRIANVSCGGCHARFEPLAFGLEKFDGLGAFQKKDEHGNELREDGEILFPGEASPVAYQNTGELMNLLARHERVQETITWKLTQFALGRPLTAADAPIVKQIHQSSQAEGGTYSSLITAIIMSDLVQLARTESSPLETE